MKNPMFFRNSKNKGNGASISNGVKKQKMRIEKDSLGARPVPASAYYGIETVRAVENFPVSGLRFHSDFTWALAAIKKALLSISPDELLSLTQEYAASAYVQTAPRQMIPHATTWFNQRRWETDREEWQQPYQEYSSKRSCSNTTQVDDPYLDHRLKHPHRKPTSELIDLLYNDEGANDGVVREDESCFAG